MNLFTKRIGLLLSAVVGVGGIAALSIGASFSLFSATSPGTTQAFTAGTVSLNGQTSAGCPVANLEPGDKGSCQFNVNYGGSLPAYLGADATATGVLAPELTLTIGSVTQPGVGPVLFANTATNGDAAYGVTVDYSLALDANNTYQGQSAVVTVTFYAVQCSNNEYGNPSYRNDDCQGVPNDWAAVLYNSTLSPLPGNLPSYGPEAYAYNEIGNEVNLTTAGSTLGAVEVTMSSWACQSGNWTAGTCVTTPGATYPVPVTLTIYNPGGSPGTVGSAITTDTQTFNIPYRPSADNAQCSSPGEWYDASASSCYNGLATNVVFNFTGVTLPGTVIYSISFNTDHYGLAPLGGSNSPTDSLNVGFTTASSNISSGSDANPGYIFVNSALSNNLNIFCSTVPTDTLVQAYNDCITVSGAPPLYDIPAVEFMAS